MAKKREKRQKYDYKKHIKPKKEKKASQTHAESTHFELTAFSYDKVGRAYKINTKFGALMIPKVWVSRKKRRRETVKFTIQHFWGPQIREKITALGGNYKEICKSV